MVLFKPGLTRHSILTKGEDILSLGKQSRVMYHIDCTSGQVYIGKAIRKLETRMNQHWDARDRDGGESALAEHAWKQQHPINQEKTTVLSRLGGTNAYLRRRLSTSSKDHLGVVSVVMVHLIS